MFEQDLKLQQQYIDAFKEDFDKAYQFLKDNEEEPDKSLLLQEKILGKCVFDNINEELFEAYLDVNVVFDPILEDANVTTNYISQLIEDEACYQVLEEDDPSDDDIETHSDEIETKCEEIWDIYINNLKDIDSNSNYVEIDYDTQGLDAYDINGVYLTHKAYDEFEDIFGTVAVPTYSDIYKIILEAGDCIYAEDAKKWYDDCINQWQERLDSLSEDIEEASKELSQLKKDVISEVKELEATTEDYLNLLGA